MAPATSNLGFLLSKAAEQCNERLAERFTAAGFPEMRPSYVAVLLPLFEHDRLRMTELAQRAALSKQRLTVLVPRCERDGFVQQERDRNDRRAFHVTLTQRARELQPVVERALAELDQATLATVGQHDHQALVRALKRLTDR